MTPAAFPDLAVLRVSVCEGAMAYCGCGMGRRDTEGEEAATARLSGDTPPPPFRAIPRPAAFLELRVVRVLVCASEREGVVLLWKGGEEGRRS
ncbi:hypothetical protein CVT26_005202 [Gymnopilus dilepis]|uniref:Uncharacterized protein n=1 Tax=Gymnopilus dilepis TaxID=231916 RepID=A0A409X4S9_9AGAR|nr:hypothetical protein CVT26_005202 [Gymnopilus dilepis]